MPVSRFIALRTSDNGNKVVPSYLLKPISVDASNWKEALITSGYYNADAAMFMMTAVTAIAVRGLVALAAERTGGKTQVEFRESR